MAPVLFPLVGFLAGLICGWLRSNVLFGAIAAVIISSLLGWVLMNQLDPRAIDYLVLALSIFLAVLVSFFGSILGVRLRAKFVRIRK